MKNAANHRAPNEPNKKKLLAFKIAAVLLSLISLLLLEGILRLSGYGTNYPLFIAAEDHPDYLMMNPEISKKYFFDQENATTGYQELFKKKKHDNTFRVFVLGASTGVGYPYKQNGSFHRWLQYGLNSTYPNMDIEIINLSLTAINTYTLLDFTKELVDYEPNAVLMYAGHNEYYGALGVGSANALGKSPWIVNLLLKLKEYRLVQLIGNSYINIKKWGNPEKEHRETLMKKMVAHQKIPYKSKLYEQGIYQFRNNLQDILSLLHKKSIPTFIGTLVSNEKDLPPFISDSTDQKNSARYQYQMGKQKYRESDFSTAKEHFVTAKEMDLLRFRAPNAMNKIIRKLADEYSNVHLVHTYAYFEDEISDGIIGNETLLEHVHPNLKGYSLLAHAFYRVMIHQKMFSGSAEKTLPWNILWEQMPITEVDSLQGAYEIMALKEGWPFHEPIPKIDKTDLSIPEILAGQMVIKELSWEQAMENLYQHRLQTKNYELAYKVAEGITLAYPHEPRFFIKAAELAVRLHKIPEADYLFKRAFSLDKSPDLAKKIAVTLVEQDALVAAMPYLEFIRKEEPDNRYGVRLHKTVNSIIELTKDGFVPAENTDTLLQLAEYYLLLGKRDKAASFLKQLLERDPSNPKALKLFEDIK
ncbi:MAG: hypothetical protein WBG90_19735 [Saonia sp.]